MNTINLPGVTLHTNCPGCNKSITVDTETNCKIPLHWFNHNGEMCDWSFSEMPSI